MEDCHWRFSPSQSSEHAEEMGAGDDKVRCKKMFVEAVVTEMTESVFRENPQTLLGLARLSLAQYEYDDAAQKEREPAFDLGPRGRSPS